MHEYTSFQTGENIIVKTPISMIYGNNNGNNIIFQQGVLIQDKNTLPKAAHNFLLSRNNEYKAYFKKI